MRFVLLVLAGVIPAFGLAMAQPVLSKPVDVIDPKPALPSCAPNDYKCLALNLHSRGGNQSLTQGLRSNNPADRKND